jgi:hypothetical protein
MHLKTRLTGKLGIEHPIPWISIALFVGLDAYFLWPRSHPIDPA